MAHHLSHSLRCAFMLAAVLVAALLANVSAQLGQSHFSGAIDDPAIGYSARPTTEPVARLAAEIAAGKIKLTFEAAPVGAGYLKSVLDALDVPVTSQILVFTKTGIQGRLTGPTNPRALYFNDSAVVGFIRGAPILEIAVQDAQQGVVFYSVPQTADAPAAPTRRNQCVTCHQSLATLDVPGMLVRSNFASPEGVPMRQLGSFLVDHRTPFADRWGGWFVTGTHGAIRHLGNAVVRDAARPEAAMDATTLNVKSLEGRFDSSGYPSTQSDLVALMVFDHQMHAINLMTRVGWEARVAEAARRFDVEAEPLSTGIRELADYLLFVDEAPLASPVEGTTRFAAAFSARGPHDRRKRSLRQLDLRTRLMHYPCSYMIYSAAFDGLSDAVRSAVYQRMWRLLSGDAGGLRMSTADRRAIIEILRDTKKDLPSYFR